MKQVYVSPQATTTRIKLAIVCASVGNITPVDVDNTPINNQIIS